MRGRTLALPLGREAISASASTGEKRPFRRRCVPTKEAERAGWYVRVVFFFSVRVQRSELISRQGCMTQLAVRLPVHRPCCHHDDGKVIVSARLTWLVNLTVRNLGRSNGSVGSPLFPPSPRTPSPLRLNK